MRQMSFWRNFFKILFFFFLSCFYFISTGVDFNNDAVERIGKIKNCSYMTVKHSRDFKKMMDEDFQYLVRFIYLFIFFCLFVFKK